ncbi:MAG: hypothetical protein M3Y71_14815 [Actinomycetota bacterium]|nr:hypothetical protein [Actinomycetota bacterium]
MKEFPGDPLTDLAATLTSEGVPSVVAALNVLISLLGRPGPTATKDVLDLVSTVAPGSSAQVVPAPITQARCHRTGAGIGAVAGVIVAAVVILVITVALAVVNGPVARQRAARDKTHGSLAGVVLFLVWMWVPRHRRRRAGSAR